MTDKKTFTFFIIVFYGVWEIMQPSATTVDAVRVYL